MDPLPRPVGPLRVNAPPWSGWLASTGTSAYPLAVVHPSLPVGVSDPVVVPNNVLVLTAGDRVVLVDTGLPGEAAPPVLAVLAAVGVRSDEVTDVLLTHFHPDHLGGILAGSVDSPTFPSARVLVARQEWEYFTDEANLAYHAGRVADSARAIRPLLEAAPLELFPGSGGEALPGIRVLPAPGHTPGHIALAIGRPPAVMYGADLVSDAAQLVDPCLPSGFDREEGTAARSRRLLFDQAHAHRWATLFSHVAPPDPAG